MSIISLFISKTTCAFTYCEHLHTVTNSRAKPKQTPSVEKHAHPQRVVYCAIYYTLTRFTKFRVSNLHITNTPDAVNTLHQRSTKGGYPVTSYI